MEEAGGGCGEGWRRLHSCGRSDEFAGGWRRLVGSWTEAGKGWRTLEEAGGWSLDSRGKLEEVGGRWSCFGEAGGGWGRLQRRLEEGWREAGGGWKEWRRLQEAGAGWRRLDAGWSRLEGVKSL